VYIIAISFLSSVPYVPINTKILNEVYWALDIKDNDRIVDIGSGDGKVLRYFNKKNCNAKYTGIELSLPLTIFSKILSMNINNIRYINKDMFKVDFSEYNKAYMYLTTDIASEIFKKLVSEMPKGSIIVSTEFKYSDEIMDRYNIEKQSIKIDNKIHNIYIFRL